MSAMKVAITGAATGIGAEVARIFKQRGAHVTAFDLVEPQANVDRWVETDLADFGSIDRALLAADGEYDALCNVAGLPPRDGLSEQILRVNFFGLRRFTLGMLDRMREGGAIVNVASRAGARWRENLAQVKALMRLAGDGDVSAFVAANAIDDVRAYDLSKEAVTVWTMRETGALLDRGLRANSISPAAVQTRILDDFIAAFGERATRGIARVGRPATAAEAAEVVVFLASPESGWLRGIDVTADGGLSAIFGAEALGLTGGA